MGLSRQALRFIAAEHRRQPIQGELVQLGRQTVAVDPGEFAAIMRMEELEPQPVPPELKHSTADVIFFTMLGVPQVTAMDFSDYEGAEYIHDLNQPLPAAYQNRFDFVIDGGTTEHVFDVRQNMCNIAQMVKPGGRVLHMIPTNNYVNHGFYQFSPTFFFDFYEANHFANLRGFLVDHPSDLASTDPWIWDTYELHPLVEEFQIASSNAFRSMITAFFAEKTATSTAHVIPTQRRYAMLVQPPAPADATPAPTAAPAVPAAPPPPKPATNPPPIMTLLSPQLKYTLRERVPGVKGLAQAYRRWRNIPAAAAQPAAAPPPAPRPDQPPRIPPYRLKFHRRID